MAVCCNILSRDEKYRRGIEMKRSVLFVLLFLIFSLVTCAKEEFARPHVTALFTPEPVTIDGIVDEAIWQKSQILQLRDSRSSLEIADSAYSTTTLTCYDSANLYIAFICNDPDIHSSFTERDQHLWEEEVVEAFIDTDDEADNYVEIEVAPNNVLFDSYIVDPVNIDVEATAEFHLPGMISAVSIDGTLNQREDTDRRWTVEIAIPFIDMIENFRPSMLKDAVWKINYYRINRDSRGPTACAWSPTGGSFHRPDRFGIIEFK